MNILVTHVYSNDNKGDAALLSVLLTDIARGFDDPKVTILTLDAISKGETFDGVLLRNSFMHYAREQYQNPLAKALYSIYAGLYTLAWAFVRGLCGVSLPLSRPLKEVAALYEKADLIIPVGGGYIRSQAGLMATITLFFIIQPLLFARLLGKRTIGYTQSIGPFGNAFQEAMAKYAVKKMDGIIVREDISMQLLRKWGIAENVFASVDSGFSFASAKAKDIRSELNIPEGRMLVGITVRSWMRTREQAEYERAVAELADHVILRHKAAVVFIPQVTVEHHHDDDRVAGQRVHALMRQKAEASVIMERYDHHAIKAIYGGLDYLVGTRFHSVIFALTSYVPCIAIGYEHKTRGIMRDLGLEEWVVDIEKAGGGGLASLFDRLVEERPSYLRHLRETLPGYVQRSQDSIGIVRRIYEMKPGKNNASRP